MEALLKDPITSLVGAVAFPLNLAVMSGKITNDQASLVIQAINLIAPALLLWAKDRKRS